MWKKVSILLAFSLLANVAVAGGPKPRKLFKQRKPAVVNSRHTKLTRSQRPVLPSMDERTEQEFLSLLQKSTVAKPIIKQANQTGKTDILKYLIRNNIHSQLVLKSLLDNPAGVKWALENGTTVTDPQIYYEAVRQGNRETVNLLCEELKPSDAIKYVMFYEAVENNHFAIAQDLLDKYGVDINTQAVEIPLREDSILLEMLTSTFSTSGQIEFLLKNGADPNLVLKNGNTLYLQLHISDRYNFYFNKLREYGAVLEGKMLEKANATLHEAIDDLDQTRVLVEAGADPNFKKDGLTPLERVNNELSHRGLGTDYRNELNLVKQYYESLPSVY